ncbi:MAG: DUF3460 family protein [Hydrogenophilaceae bacterium]|nr:DUF3460 family protein [Hydrogenophilaceae bacterium]
MDRAYVSEFTLFMNKYLKEHPEVVKDQQRGWKIYWNPAAGPTESKKPDADRLAGHH